MDVFYTVFVLKPISPLNRLISDGGLLSGTRVTYGPASRNLQYTRYKIFCVRDISINVETRAKKNSALRNSLY